MKIISVLNLKGGVAKTTTVINMAYVLNRLHDKKVLILDNDMQANVTDFFNLKNENEFAKSGEILTDNVDMRQIPCHTQYEGLDIIQSGLNLTIHMQRLNLDNDRVRMKHLRLKNALEKINDIYDYCIIDNPPDINLCVINALYACDDVIIPVTADKDSFSGMEYIIQSINEAKEVNKEIRLKGCLFTRYQKNKVNYELLENLHQVKYTPFDTVIRNSVKAIESKNNKVPLLLYSPRCNTSKDYIQFVEEYLS